MTEIDSEIEHGHARKKEKGIKKNILDRFVHRIKGSFAFFQEKPPMKSQLTGRIQDMQKAADTVLLELLAVKEDLKKSIDPEFFAFLEAVVDPLVKEVSKIKKTAVDQETVSRQAHTFKRYSQWIEKAKIWVQICSKKDKEGIIRAVIKLTIQDFLEVIGRDLQVIEDYMEHMIENLAVNEEEKIALAQKIMLKVEPYIHSLKALRVKAEEIPLSKISEWKAKVDKKRERYFEGALYAIDKIIDKANPSAAASEEEHEHLVEVFSQIALLEEEIPEFLNEVEQIKEVDDFLKNKFDARLEEIKKGLHQLNLDLRLTPELIDRLQFLFEMTSRIKEKLNRMS